MRLISLNEIIAPDEFVALLQATFDGGRELTFTPSGVSMLPMLDGREDKVTLAPVRGRLRRDDVAFYRRDSGQLVLHRMIGFTREGGYIFCGDHQYSPEYGVTDGDLLAVLSRFTHRGRERSVNALSYRLYCRAIALRRGTRRVLSRLYHLIRRQ